jgi:hypothetical protein
VYTTILNSAAAATDTALLPRAVIEAIEKEMSQRLTQECVNSFRSAMYNTLSDTSVTKVVLDTGS